MHCCLQGILLGLLVGAVLLLLKHRMLIKKGVGTDVKYLSFDKHTWDLFRKERVLYVKSGRLQEFNEYVKRADELVGAVINKDTVSWWDIETTTLSEPLKRTLWQLDKVATTERVKV